MNERRFTLKKRRASRKDYSFYKSRNLGAFIVPDFQIPTTITNQDDAGAAGDCTAYAAIGARQAEVPNSLYDPVAFWNDELAFANLRIADGFSIEVPAAVGIKVGFCPSGNPSLRQDRASAYFWINPHNGMDLFDSTLQAIYTTKYPAIGGLFFYKEWVNSPVIDSMGKNALGGHAIRIVGKKTINDVPYIILANTWGTAAGQDGFHFISREVFNKAFSEYGIFQWSDSENITIKTLGLIQSLYQNLLTLLRIPR